MRAERRRSWRRSKQQGLLTAEPFDEPIDFTYFELWHHWGRTAKFGVWMQGPDYTQWHGVYELLSDLAELQGDGGDKLEAGQRRGSSHDAPGDASSLPLDAPRRGGCRSRATS